MSHWESSGKNNNWYTPKYVFDAMGEVRFDLDVAGKHVKVNSVPSDFTYAKDSLERDWHGFVWMNPPFGGRNGLQPWLEKFLDHGNGIALTPDRTSAPWFRYAWDRAQSVLFTPKIRFIREDGSLGKSPSNGTALWAVGEKAVAALINARDNGLGILAKPETEASLDQKG